MQTDSEKGGHRLKAKVQPQKADVKNPEIPVPLQSK